MQFLQEILVCPKNKKQSWQFIYFLYGQFDTKKTNGVELIKDKLVSNTLDNETCLI